MAEYRIGSRARPGHGWQTVRAEGLPGQPRGCGPCAALMRPHVHARRWLVLGSLQGCL